MIVAAPILFIMLQAVAPAPKAPAAAPQTLTKTSVQAQVKTNFDRLDTNKDGIVDKAEAQKAHDANVAAVAKRHSELVAEAFAKADTDKNGALSLKEFEAATPAPNLGETSTWLQTNDTNKDGKVSLAEATAHAMTNFDRLDGNKDGVISNQEARAASQRRQ